MKSNTFTSKDASSYTFAIVQARFNTDITEGLLQGAHRALESCNVPQENIMVYEVPGSYDIPYGVHIAMREGRKPDAFICLGAIIKGETDHDEHIATAVFGELHRLQAAYITPIALGIITVQNPKQGHVRSAEDDANVGYQAAHAAVELLGLRDTEK